MIYIEIYGKWAWYIERMYPRSTHIPWAESVYWLQISWHAYQQCLIQDLVRTGEYFQNPLNNVHNMLHGSRLQSTDTD